MAPWRIVALIIALAASSAADVHEGVHEEHRERLKQYHAEQAHLNKIPSHEVDDWTIHKDVDDSMYWFSRSLRRSTRDAPAGWTKNSAGEWKAPPRRRDEL